MLNAAANLTYAVAVLEKCLNYTFTEGMRKREDKSYKITATLNIGR
jgi:hypothetical protein